MEIVDLDNLCWKDGRTKLILGTETALEPVRAVLRLCARPTSTVLELAPFLFQQD
jgi:hypothetical protein